MSLLDEMGEIEDDRETMLSQNAQGHFLVRYDMGFGNETTVQIEEYSAGSTDEEYPFDPWFHRVHFPPWEALALLAWLEQEKPHLEHLGKGQEGDDVL